MAEAATHVNLACLLWEADPLPASKRVFTYTPTSTLIAGASKVDLSQLLRISPAEITLWKPSVPIDITNVGAFDQWFTDHLDKLMASFATCLGFCDPMSDVVGTANLGCHLLIILHSGPKRGRPVSEDTVSNANRRIRREMYGAPSLQAWSIQHSPLLCGRPSSATHDVPITLLHPVFAEFVQNCEDHLPTHEDNSFVLQLSAGMPDFYENETARATYFRELMGAYGVDLAAPSAVDGHAYADARVNGFPYIVTTANLDFGSAASDPYIKSAQYHLQALRGRVETFPNSVLPCLHIFYAGPYIGFAGSAISNGLAANVLGPMLPLCWHPTDEQLRLRAARVFGAFKKAALTLKQYYEKIAADPSNNDGPRSPYPRSYHSLDDPSIIHTFRYQKILVSERLIFRCQGEHGTPICVKFVRRYSKDAHLLCAKHGWAPRLYGFEELPGGWSMVVMELLTEHRPFSRTHHYAQHEAIQQKAREYVLRLHHAGYVHGDVRRSNLMVECSGREPDVRIIDWDWAGKNGEVRYPPNVTRELDGFARPEDASDGNLITAEHDLVMLDLL